MFEDLTKYLPDLERTESYGEWVVDRESKGTMDGPIQMPFVNHESTVSDIVKAVYDFEEEHPKYELGNYRGILKRNRLKWDSEVMASADVS